jgi:putative intracellular protease/amidase
MSHILMMLSSAARMPLADGSSKDVGFWPEEVTAPLRVFRGASAQVTMATPDGAPAVPDQAGFTPEGTRLPPDRCAVLRDDVAGLRSRLEHPASLRETDWEAFDAVFVPGGYAPMVDLSSDPGCGRILTAMHDAGRPVAAVCHGPAALLACARPEGAWPFEGFRMTSFTDDEEKDVGLLGLLPWTAQQALTRHHAEFAAGPGAWQEHVVEDRGLLTGQNPASAAPLAHRLMALTGTRLSAASEQA